VLFPPNYGRFTETCSETSCIICNKACNGTPWAFVGFRKRTQYYIRSQGCSAIAKQSPRGLKLSTPKSSWVYMFPEDGLRIEITGFSCARGRQKKELGAKTWGGGHFSTYPPSILMHLFHPFTSASKRSSIEVF
jgi:hypothetical protein